ncbi:NAD(P)/FAD-dependent oxidoreductase [Pseudothauera rhizosphaerae]|uniref:NAD(P)/FAD-dependent oxidoreductase n=1 Tax=Pseudothauera rhizosphaerae TaxID=2565932 RepID=A0A4S4AS18_9RHOO|nr:NAD(P)/FAD-dependent oxidoreductase [Pseudothauera rhizosphaerae]THF62498.1 NAD(P)/FAD-dependent oxidoreductase [Pseudothauera rhizosphaerae]
METREVVVIGAGPSGAVAAALLKRQGHDVLVLERERFPRFCIGESLLAHCLEFIEEAGMMDAVRAAGFQIKNGAAFACGDTSTHFDFRDKFSPGPGATFQVQRARFDKLLADEAERQGVEIRYEQEVVAADFGGETPVLDIRAADGTTCRVGCRFVLDASGYGRVLARLCDLEQPSALPPRKAVFTHIEDRIDDPAFDREKILISVHPEIRSIWYWLIPFSNGRSSIGVVGRVEEFGAPGEALMDTLRHMCDGAPNLRRLLGNAQWDTPANTITGYSASVTSLYGPGYALLGNASEFLDPVFSSGVTIALRSSKLAADALHRQLRGEAVDWQADFADPLMVGVETFRAYVNGWYDGSFQDVVFYEQAQPEIRRMISSVLAGYAWDRDNPYVAEPGRRLQALASICAGSTARAAATA